MKAVIPPVLGYCPRLQLLQDYIFDETDANFRVATFDPKKVFITTIYTTGTYATIEAIKRKYGKMGLLYVSHGTFSGITTPVAVPPAPPLPPYTSPAGDVVGYKSNITDFNIAPTKNKVIQSGKEWEKRWYFGIKLNKNIEFLHPDNADTDFVWDGYDRANFDTDILTNYRLIIHGGIILFDEKDSKLKLPQTEAKFKDIVIKYNDKTWQNTNENAWMQARGWQVLPRIVIGLNSSGKIIFVSCGQGRIPVQGGSYASRGGMRLFPLATKLKSIGVTKAILYDSSWPVGVWARPELEKPFPNAPNGVARDSTTNLLVAFQVRNTQIINIGGIPVPEGDEKRSEAVPVIFPESPAQSFTVKLKITKSDYFKETKEVRLYIMQEKAYYDKYVKKIEPGAGEAVRKIWNGGTIPWDTSFDWTAPDTMLLMAITSNDPNKRLVIVFRSQADVGWNKEIIFEHVLPVRPTPAVHILFFMDNSKNISSVPNLVAKRNEALERMGLDAFQRKGLPPQLGTYSRFSTRLAVMGFDNTIQPQYWKENQADFLKGFHFLNPTGETSNYNTAFLMLKKYGLLGYSVFNKLSIIFFAAGPHEAASGNQEFDPDPEITALKDNGIVLHAIGYRLSPKDQAVLNKLAQGTGGISKAISNVNDIQKVFLEIYNADQNEKFSQTSHYDLNVGQTCVHTLKMLTFGIATLRFLWDISGTVYPDYTIEVMTPSGQVFKPSHPTPPEVVIDHKEGYVVFTISSPVIFNADTDTEWKITIKRIRNSKTKKQNGSGITLIISQSDLGIYNPETMELKGGMVPLRHGVLSNLYVSVQASQQHLTPDKVYFMAKFEGTNVYKKYLLQPAGNGLFNGEIQSQELKMGILKGYFHGESGDKNSLLPLNAPEECFETLIGKSQIIIKSVLVPETVEIPDPLRIELNLEEDSPAPSAISFYFRFSEDSPFQYISLNRMNNSCWKGEVPSSLLKPGLMQGYLLAKGDSIEGSYPDDAPDELIKTEIVKPFKFLIPSLPEVFEKDHSLPIQISFSDISQAPDFVNILFRYEGTNTFQSQKLNLSANKLFWEGEIPKEMLNKKGNLEVYFFAKKNDKEIICPETAPQGTFRIKIIEINPVYLPWVLDIVSKEGGDHFYKTVLTRRRMTGDEDFQCGQFIVPSRYWYGKIEGIDRSAMLNDPFDDSLWVYHTNEPSLNAKTFLLTQITSTGKKGKEITTEGLWRLLTFDYFRNQLLGVDAGDMRILYIKNLTSLKTAKVVFDDYVFSIYVDELRGKILLGFARSGIHEYIGNGKTEVIHNALNSTRIIHLKANGDLLVRCSFNSDSSNQPNIALIDPLSQVKSKTSLYGLGLEYFYDPYTNHLWALDDICNPRYLYYLNDDLNIIFCIHSQHLNNTLYFQSIAFDPVNGGIWASGLNSNNKGFLGYINPEGIYEQKSFLNTGGRTNVFRDFPGIMTSAVVPYLIFKGNNLPLKIKISNKEWIPEKIFADVECTSQKNVLNIPLKPEENGMVWVGNVPGSALTGNDAFVYFRSDSKGKHSFYPRGAPQQTLRVQIESQGKYLWSSSVDSFTPGKDSFSARFFICQFNGGQHKEMGTYTLPKDPDAQYFFSEQYFVTDPRDGSLWFIQVNTKDNKYELVHLFENKSKNVVPLPSRADKLTYDPECKRMYLAGSSENASLMYLNMANQRIIVIGTFRTYYLGEGCITKNVLLWGWGTGRERGLYQLEEDETLRLIFKSEHFINHVQRIEGGEIICSHDFFQEARRILRLSSEGKVLAYSKKDFLSSNIILKMKYDAVNKNIIVLYGTTIGLFIVRYDLDFNPLLIYSTSGTSIFPFTHNDFNEKGIIIGQLSNFTLNPHAGSLMILGIDSNSESFLAYEDSKRRLLYLSRMTGQSWISAFG